MFVTFLKTKYFHLDKVLSKQKPLNNNWMKWFLLSVAVDQKLFAQIQRGDIGSLLDEAGLVERGGSKSGTAPTGTLCLGRSDKS